jgi:superfamily II DNA or RNA helicase
MMVFCMSCKHADHVARQINGLCRELDLPYRTDWIGVGEGWDGNKSPAENDRIKQAYEAGDLRIIVQVSKLEEGFDDIQTSVLVFLHLIGADSRLTQQLGRGLRRNRALPFNDDTCCVFADASGKLAEIIRKMELERLRNEDAPTMRDDTGEQDKERWSTVPDLVLVDSTYDRTEMVSPEGLPILKDDQRAFCDKWNIPPHVYLEHFRAQTGGHLSAEPKPMIERDRLQLQQEQVNHSLRIVTGNIIRGLHKNGRPVGNATAGQVKKAVNSRWKHETGNGHDAMMAQDFQAKNKWLQRLNTDIKQTRVVPSWLKL